MGECILSGVKTDVVTPFTFVKHITETKLDIFAENEKVYNPFLINRALSYNVDCLFFVQEINKYSFLEKKTQHEYLLNSIAKKKRNGKWIKKDTMSEDLILLKNAYGYSNEQAEIALRVISDKNLLELRKKMNKGGKIK